MAEPEPEPNEPWTSLLGKLGLSGDENLAEVGKTEDEAALQLRVAILDAEQEDARMAAVDSLVAHKEAKKDERHEAIVAALTAAKDAEIEQLKAQLAER